MERDEIDTLPKLEVAENVGPLTKEQFQIACQIVTDVALTAAGCLGEMVDEAKGFDKELADRCEDAKKALDIVVSHIVCRVT